MTMIRIQFFVVTRGSITSIRRFIKEEYVGKTFKVPSNNRTEIVRLMMNATKQNIDRQAVKLLRRFLNRFYLTNAEIAAIIHHTGYRYKVGTGLTLRHIQINGYLNPKLEVKK